VQKKLGVSAEALCVQCVPQNENGEMQTQNITQTSNNMLNNTNILYAFNLTLLTTVFAADVR